MDETQNTESAPLNLDLIQVDELKLARRLTDRKFVLALGGLFISTIMRACHQIESGEYVTLCLAIYGGFLTAHVWEKKQ